jgi:RHH-type proline utilization regulon transcriptional repressor/proline dehydrogenase/delta 1-pyrroline-5-carboxylate dehydrogenase
MVSASLVAGNCVIFKPSGLSPVCGWKLFEAFRHAGLPAGVLQFITGPGAEVGAYLSAHKAIDFIAFTGSKEVGLGIVELAGTTMPGQRSIKRVIAELGGKNAVIVTRLLIWTKLLREYWRLLWDSRDKSVRPAHGSLLWEMCMTRYAFA